MSDDSPMRFMVRQGSDGWMVYDRQRRAPAIVGTTGTHLAANLTKGEADRIRRLLMAKPESEQRGSWRSGRRFQ
jgi:hypothetical protein